MRARDAGRVGLRERGAFTLVEVLVALTVSAVVLLGARALLESVADGTERIVSSSDAAAREVNDERTMRQLVWTVEVAGPDTLLFEGSRTSARFATWCATADGWLARCTAEMILSATGDSSVALQVATSAGDELRLTYPSRRGALLYLERPDHGGRWVPAWPARIVPPLAIGVVLDTDTVIVRVGERG